MKGLRVASELTLPADWILARTVVYGASGSGKTTFGAVAAEEAHYAGYRFCVIDVKGDFWGLKAAADSRGEGIPVVIFGGDHADLPLEDGAGQFLGELVAGLNQSCVLDLEHMSKPRQIRFLADFFASLYHHSRDPLFVIADESQRYAPQNLRTASTDSNAKGCLGAVEDLVKLGRKHGIGVLLLTQRGANLNKDVSELCDMMVAFRTPGGLDQARVREGVDSAGYLRRLDPAKVGEAVAGERLRLLDDLDNIAEFEDGEALVVSAKPGLKMFAHVRMRRRDTFDSSATPKLGQRRAEPKRLAQPELDSIRGRMSEAIERQKASDPKALREEIDRLRAELASKAPAAECVEVPVVPAGVVHELGALAVLLRSHSDTVSGVAMRVSNLQGKMAELPQANANGKHDMEIAAIRGAKPFRDMLTPPAPAAPTFSEIEKWPATEDVGKGEGAVLGALIDYDQGEGLTRVQLRQLTHYKRSALDTYIHRLIKRQYAKATPNQTIAATDAGRAAMPGRPSRGVELNKGEREILAALIAYSELTRTRIGVLTGYKRSSRDAYIYRLVNKGLATTSASERVAVTERGRAALPECKPLPTGPAAIDYWRERLPIGERKIFDCLWAAGKRGASVMTPDAISEQTGYRRSSRDTYLYRMESRGVIARSSEGVQLALG